MDTTQRLSTLPQSEKLRVIERLFQRLATAFGNQWLSKWTGMQMELVFSDWAEDLGELSIGQIKHGIELSRKQVHPPNLGEFITLAKQYTPELVPESNRLGRKKTEEEKQFAKQKMAEILANFARIS